MAMHRLIKSAFAIFCLVIFSIQPVFAKIISNQPPVSVKGFDHRYISQSRIHMNSCKVQRCIPGSLVSYSLFGPKKSLNFEEFKKGQRRTADFLQKRASRGVKITLGKAKKTKHKLFTRFSSIRKMQSANGSIVYTLSTVVYGKRFAISIISSSKSKVVAERNRALFLVGLMALDQEKR